MEEEDEEIGFRHGQWPDWCHEEVEYLVEELASGMAADTRQYFDGYWGAAAALRIARAYIELGDTPEANEIAVAQIGVLVRYAMDSWYWGNEAAPVRPDDCDPEHRPLVRALQGIEHAAAPIVTITGTVDWDGLHRYARRA